MVARRRPSLRMRWALSLAIGVAVLVALVLFVEHNNNNSEASGNAHALARENHEAEVVIGEDQAPQMVRLTPGQSVRAAAVAAVGGDMRHRIAIGNLNGPWQGVRCTQGAVRGARRAVSCTARAADVRYPFVGVVNTDTRTLVYCKQDLPPIPSENIPVSARCRL